MSDKRQLLLKSYLKNQLDLYLLRGINDYFLEEEKWMSSIHLDILWDTFLLLQKATEEIASCLLFPIGKKTELDERILNMFFSMFRMLKPLLDIMKEMDSRKEYDDLMVRFQWMSSGDAWMGQKREKKPTKAHRRKIQEMMNESTEKVIDKRIKKTIKHLLKNSVYPE